MSDFMVPITYKEISHPGAVDLKLLEKLETAIFYGSIAGTGEASRLSRGTEGRNNLLAHVAFAGETPVGFKLGYESAAKVFYSWLGGVLPDWRRQGVAQELLRIQHQSVQALGYKKITTKSRNQFPAMLILNIKNGFHIVGTEFRDEKKHLSILFAKTF